MGGEGRAKKNVCQHLVAHGNSCRQSCNAEADDCISGCCWWAIWKKCMSATAASMHNLHVATACHRPKTDVCSMLLYFMKCHVAPPRRSEWGGKPRVDAPEACRQRVELLPERVCRGLHQSLGPQSTPRRCAEHGRDQFVRDNDHFGAAACPRGFCARQSDGHSYPTR